MCAPLPPLGRGGGGEGGRPSSLCTTYRVDSKVSQSSYTGHRTPIELHTAADMIRTTSKDHDTMIVKHQIMFLAIVRHVEIVCLGWVLCGHCINLMSTENASENSYAMQVASTLSCTRVDEYNSPLYSTEPLHQIEAWCITILIKMNLICMFSCERTGIKTCFEKEGQVNST